MTRRVQSISPNDPHAMRKVIEALEVSEGVRGNADDRKPTIKEVRTMLGSGNGGNGAVGTKGESSGGVIPSKPSGVLSKSLIDQIVISWDWPSYNGHSGSEVYRAITDSLGDSIHIGSTGANYFIDWSAAEGQTYYYFVRHKNAISLGGRTSPYADSVSGKRQAIIKPVAKAGIITTTTSVDIDLGAIDDGKTILISIAGIFISEIEYDAIGASLLPEDGNAVSIELKKNGVVIQTLTPTKNQISLTGANGEAKYLHTTNKSSVEASAAGALLYTLTATRIFPANTDPFEVSYSIQSL